MAHTITRLNAAARATLRANGIGLTAWYRYHFGTNKWHGDACGCPNDRCIGYHHAANEECGCLPRIIENAREAFE